MRSWASISSPAGAEGQLVFFKIQIEAKGQRQTVDAVMRDDRQEAAAQLIDAVVVPIEGHPAVPRCVGKKAGPVSRMVEAQIKEQIGRTDDAAAPAAHMIITAQALAAAIGGRTLVFYRHKGMTQFKSHNLSPFLCLPYHLEDLQHHSGVGFGVVAMADGFLFHTGLLTGAPYL